MQPLRFARRSALLLIALAALTMIQGPAMAQDATVSGTLNYVSGAPGAEIYRYDYTVSNAGMPNIQVLLLFFDSDPATPGFDGSDDCDFHSATGPTPDWEVEAIEGPDPDAWYVDFSNWSTLGPGPGEELGLFSVEILWKNPDTVPPTALFFEAMDGWAHEGTTETRVETTAPREGVVAGHVFGCDGAPLVGVTVDLFSGELLVGSMLTNAAGEYRFSVQLPGAYVVNVVTPLGYFIEDEIPNNGNGQYLDFLLGCQITENDPRTIGFWKHQVNVYITGKGKAQVTKTAMLAYLDNLYSHFHLNPIHPVSVYNLPPATLATTKLNTAQDILTVNGGALMNLRARQQLMALLLNVASLKLSQTAIITADGIQVNQAITYAWDLIADGNAANDELAKTICDEINNAHILPAGMVPAGTPVILYARPVPAGPPVAPIVASLKLGQNYPNPFNPATRIPFSIPSSVEGMPVRLDIFDMGGRLVRTLVDDMRGEGEYVAAWDGADGTGSPVASGIYFYRLTAGAQKETRKLHLLK